MDLFGPNYDKKCIRRKVMEGENETRLDEAAIVEDDDSGETKIRFKSDGMEIPCPDNAQFNQLWYHKWYQKLLFMPEQRVDFFEFVQTDKEDGDFIKFDFDNSKAGEAGMDRMFNTHRDFLAKKTIEMFEEEDNTQLWLAGYLTILAVITLGGMYVVVSGVKGSISTSVEAGFKSALEGTQAATGAAQGAQNIIPVIGLMSINGIRNLKTKLRFWER